MSARGVWVARNGDDGRASVFSSELAALRYAVEHGMEVAHVPYGGDVFGEEATS